MGWLSSYSPVISVIDALAELSMALLILFGVRARLGRFAPLALLAAAYFLIEALVSFNRAFVRIDLEGTLSRVLVLELVGTFIVACMLARASHVARAMATVLDDARHRAAEYERARRHYSQVVRHRIANPLTVIKGAAQTLDSAGTIDESTRHALRVAIHRGLGTARIHQPRADGRGARGA